MKNKLTMLMILDGFGESENENGNAIKLAKTPNIDKLMKTCPTCFIQTSGIDVGLPEGQIGDSKVGHINIDAGRIVLQDLSRITKAIEDGDFFSNKELINAIEYAKKNNSKLHVMGLLSDGGIHSHIRHLFAILELAKRRDFENVFIHCFMDGRDTGASTGEAYIIELENKIKEKGVGKIASISGRYYAMDRDENWDRIQKVYKVIVEAEGEKQASAISAIENSYQKEVFDEFIMPTAIVNGNEQAVKIEKNDSVVFFNFRADRVKELTEALMDKDFDKFETRKDLNLYFVTMTPINSETPNIKIAFEKEKIINTFSEYIEKKGYKRLELIHNNLPSIELTNKIIEEISLKEYDNIVFDFTSADYIGHTGSLENAIKEVELIDECIGKIVEAIQKQEGVIIITADYGNVEQMIDYKTGEPHTSHTTNPAPLILVGMENIKLRDGRLSDIAPTMLQIMGEEKPEEMTGESIII